MLIESPVLRLILLLPFPRGNQYESALITSPPARVASPA